MPGGEPGRLQELLPGADEVGAAGADPLRVGEQHQRPGRQQVGEQLQLARRPAPGSATPCPRSGCPRRGAPAARAAGGLFSWTRASAAARSRTGSVSSSSRQPGASSSSTGADGALVGHGERAQLAHLVAPELDADRVLGGRREDVDDAAADGELAARGDHLDAGVGQLDQPHEQRVEVVGVADPQPHRVERAQARARSAGSGCARPRPRRGAPSPGRPSRRKIDSRRPTVSGRGESRSCGSVSQDGSTATASGPSRSAAAAPRSSASRSVAVTARTVRPAPPSPAGSRTPRRGTGAAPTGPSTLRAGTSVARRSRAASTTARRSGSDRTGLEQTGELGHGSRTPRKAGEAHAEQTPARDAPPVGPRSSLRPQLHGSLAASIP